MCWWLVAECTLFSFVVQVGFKSSFLDNEALLFNTGRAPNTKRLSLEAVGVELDKTGAIKVPAFSFSFLLFIHFLLIWPISTGSVVHKSWTNQRCLAGVRTWVI